MSDDIKQRIDALTDTLNRLAAAYYDEDQPEASDQLYDRLMQELKALEATYPDLARDDSPLRHVGGRVSERLKGIEHTVPLLSLQDVFDIAGVTQFIAFIQKESGDPAAAFAAEAKIDGLSLAIRYEAGRLIRALTRGDGRRGEDVTENARRLVGIPASLDPSIRVLEVRGEAYLSKDAFRELNDRQRSTDGKVFANARNAAAGTMRQLNPDIVGARGLAFFAFNIQAVSPVSFESHIDSLAWLASLGFAVSPFYERVMSADGVLAFIARLGEMRGMLPYDIDGAVIKADSLDLRDRLGQTAKVPRWAVAYKYPAETAETVLRRIDATVGRTGRITPLATFDPVLLAGTTISRATLHNQNMIDLLDVRVGDTVTVKKGGDIIPAIIAVDVDKRPSGSEPYRLPAACPVCDAVTHRADDTADLYCQNPDCPAQIRRRIEWFAGKDAMDIEGLGSQSVSRLADAGLLASIADIYQLHTHKEALIESGIVGREKRVGALLVNIEASKTRPLARLITGLGIMGVGQQTAGWLASHFLSIDRLAAADAAELQSIPGIGPETAASITDFFADSHAVQLIERLRADGLQMEQAAAKTGGADGPLVGESVVVTGTLPTLSRKDAHALIASLGGTVQTQVTSKTTVLVAGDAAGSKLGKAQALGVRIEDEAWLLGQQPQ